MIEGHVNVLATDGQRGLVEFTPLRAAIVKFQVAPESTDLASITACFPFCSHAAYTV